MGSKLAITSCALAVLGASALVWASKMPASGPEEGAKPGGAPTGLLSTPRHPLPPSRLTDINSREVTDGELNRGRVLLVYLTTSCKPCVDEALFISRLSESAPPGLRIFGVSFERPAQVATFAREFDLKFPLLIDAGGKLAGSLNVRYFPSAYLVEDGVITKVWRGVNRDEADFRRQLLTEN